MERNLNSQSSPEQKKDVADIVFDRLGDYLFDKISIISFPFTQVTDAAGKYTSTTLYGGESRLTDTAEGKFLAPGKQSRMKCQFYVQNPDHIVGYILSPVVYDSFTSLNTFSSLDVLRAYIGIKINGGIVTVSVKEAGGSEVNYATGLSFSGSGSTDTIVLEINYNGKSTEVYLDSERVGTYQTDFITGFSTVSTFLPLLSPAISKDGSGVNIVIENYQYIQNR